MCTNCKYYDPKIRRDHQKKFPWASRLWVGRRKESILGYVPENDEKNNSGIKGLKKVVKWLEIEYFGVFLNT